MVKKWAAEFRVGKKSMDDYEQSGHPKEATIAENAEKKAENAMEAPWITPY